MGSFGQIRLSAVWAMLEHCCEPVGYSKRQTKHHWVVTYNDKTYPALPLGSHGRRKDAEVQIGHVKKMARFLGLLECAEERLPQLK